MADNIEAVKMTATHRELRILHTYRVGHDLTQERALGLIRDGFAVSAPLSRRPSEKAVSPPALEVQEMPAPRREADAPAKQEGAAPKAGEGESEQRPAKPKRRKPSKR